jgi:hypothetical protein
MKKYIPLKTNDKATDLRVELTYDLGGYNMFDYTKKARGYYLVVTPVTRDAHMESFTAFTGLRRCVKEVKRKSKSAELSAIREAELVEKVMIDRVLAHNHLELA